MVFLANHMQKYICVCALTLLCSLGAQSLFDDSSPAERRTKCGSETPPLPCSRLTSCWPRNTRWNNVITQPLSQCHWAELIRFRVFKRKKKKGRVGGWGVFWDGCDSPSSRFSPWYRWRCHISLAWQTRLDLWLFLLLFSLVQPGKVERQ